MLALVPGAPRGRSDQSGRRHAIVGELCADRQAGPLGRRARSQGNQCRGRGEWASLRAPVRGRGSQPAGRRAKVGEAAAAGQGRSSDRDGEQRVDARSRPGCRAQQSHPGHDRVLRAVDHRVAMQSECVPGQRQCIHAIERIDGLADQERARQALLLHRPGLRDGPQHDHPRSRTTSSVSAAPMSARPIRRSGRRTLRPMSARSGPRVRM